MALIEDQELENLRQLAEQAKTALPSKQILDAMGKNPQTRERILRLMKEINPNLVIPEIDAAKPVIDKLDALAKEFNDYKKSVEDEKAESVKKKTQSEIDDQIKKGRKRLSDSGWTKEGIESVEKMMQERGLADYEAAAALFEKENPKDEPIMPTNFGRDSGLFDPPDDNPWREAVSLPKGPKQDRQLRSVQNKEINKWFAENRPNLRVRA